MVYLILFWLGCLTAALVILWNKGTKKETEEWTITPMKDLPVTKSVQIGEKQYVEFLGADRVNDILTEKKDAKIDDILV